MLTAVAELVGGLVLTVAADLLVEQLFYYEDKRGAQPKGLLTYVTAARKYVRLP